MSDFKDRLEECYIAMRPDEHGNTLFLSDGDIVRCNLYRYAIVPREDYERLTAEGGALVDFLRLIEDVLTQGDPNERVASALSLVAQALALEEYHAIAAADKWDDGR